MSLGARLTNVVAAPGELFDYLRHAKESVANWLVPALIYMVVGWACSTLVFSQDWVKPQIIQIQEEGIQKQIEAGKMTEEQAEQARPYLEKYGTIGPMIAGYAGPVVLGLAGPFLWGLILWLVGAKVLKGQFSYMKAVEVAGLTALIAALGSVVKTLLILIQGNIMASASAMILIGDFDPNNPLHAAAGWLDVMMIWSLTIKAMGIARVAGCSFTRVALWVYGLYVTFAAVVVALSVLVQRLGGG
jgi:hypothetical protein